MNKPISVGWVWTSNEAPVEPTTATTFYLQVHHRIGIKAVATADSLKRIELVGAT